MREELTMYIVINGATMVDVESRVNAFIQNMKADAPGEVWRNIEGLRCADGIWYQAMGQFEYVDSCLPVAIVG
jgi:hypothetical protein